MQTLTIEISVRVPKSYEVQLREVKKPPPFEAYFRPKRRRPWWEGILHFVKSFAHVFSVRSSVELHREVGPGLPSELIERKEPRLSF